MFQRPSTKRLSGMSKLGLDNEIEVSKSSCLLDGLYRNTFPLIFLKSKFSGNLISKPSLVFVTVISFSKVLDFSSLSISF